MNNIILSVAEQRANIEQFADMMLNPTNPNFLDYKPANSKEIMLGHDIEVFSFVGGIKSIEQLVSIMATCAVAYNDDYSDDYNELFAQRLDNVNVSDEELSNAVEIAYNAQLEFDVDYDYDFELVASFNEDGTVTLSGDATDEELVSFFNEQINSGLAICW